MDLFYFVIQQTWTFAIPLLIVALAGLFSERSGVINIALEGIMLIGALFGVSYLHLFGNVLPPQLNLIIALLIVFVRLTLLRNESFVKLGLLRAYEKENTSNTFSRSDKDFTFFSKK